MGLDAFRPWRRPLLSQKQQLARLAWCRERKDWLVQDWKEWIFSDESKINLVGSDGARWICQRVQEALKPEHVQGMRQGGGGMIMVWGLISHSGVGPFHQVEGPLNALAYRGILEDHLLPYYEEHLLDPTVTVYQQDGATSHTAQLTRDWLRDNYVLTTSWPANSPDLNIIEPVWRMLKIGIYCREHQPENWEQLWSAAREEWGRINSSYILNLYHSMPCRISAVIAARGGNTKY
jgi:hypothetical protein